MTSYQFDLLVVFYDANGRLIAGAGRPFPDGVLTRRWRHGREHGFHTMVMKLADGRSVAARIAPPFRPVHRNPIAYLAVIAAVIGLAAYPVVRHLTRRLERLRLGVEAWGSGALVTRVADSGSDEVAAVAKSFNRAAGHIEELITAHRALLANASHELRSPLARLRMAIDLHEQAPDVSRKAEIVRNLAELDTLVEEILLASRLEHVDRLDHAEAVDLLALVTEEGVRNNIEVTGTVATVKGDAQLLGRLVRNLMQNALRHGALPVTAVVARATTSSSGYATMGPASPKANASACSSPSTGRQAAARQRAAGGSVCR